MLNRLKTSYIALLYRIATLTPFRAATYSRLPFVRYPYMYMPCEMSILSNLLLSVNVPGSVVEIGCNQGWTSCWLLESMRDAGIDRPYHCLDTFDGFTAEDIAVEVGRGKSAVELSKYFIVNRPEWLRSSFKQYGYQNTTVHQADASTFNYEMLGPIAFALLDVDIYRPSKLALERLLPCMADGGIIVVDDCDRTHKLWDGANQAYIEFCQSRGLPVEIAGKKLGIIRA